ncbi:NAD(P)-binding domain-containing protein, partial [Mesorhizobium sp.]|uniref:NAD(P)-binding domain-containing protein n=1 Tax=Mesorhizobium sp. TaxID=1871066 RepID=UPI0025DA444F
MTVYDRSKENPAGARTNRAALIGIGSMGLGMAMSLRRAGFEVAGFDVDAAAVARLVDAGGRS